MTVVNESQKGYEGLSAIDSRIKYHIAVPVGITNAAKNQSFLLKRLILADSWFFLDQFHQP